jgi:membrane associated rhomboid family serine protease
VLLFILVGAMIAPSTRRKVVVTLGILGGVFGWPFGPQYSLAYGHIFYAAGAAGTLIGCALGLLLAFQWQTKRRKAEPNQCSTDNDGAVPRRV